MIDSPSLQRKYYTAVELWLLKNVELIYMLYPWKILLRSVCRGVSITKYGRKLMFDMMMTYNGNKKRYTRLAGHGYKILAQAIEKKLTYKVNCPYMVLCGKEDRAGSCLRYLKAYEKNTGKSIKWIKNAGHNSNTDRPEKVNRLIDEFLEGVIC